MDHSCDECGTEIEGYGHDLGGPVICDACFAKIPKPTYGPIEQDPW